MFHIDGFRFDLASILGRDPFGAPMANPPLLEALAFDPIIGKCKLVAEAWDAGGLYQVGSFVGHRWAEWNGPFRDEVRRFVRGDESGVRPLLSRVKLIAEPWDLGEGGYQVGNFPVGWTEWNGRYRDSVRRFWRGDGGQVSEVATRLAGSSDLYEQSGRRPYASINFVTSHDGFTLNDLVSFNEKHNAANRQDNRDGSDANFSANHGAEGPTDDPRIEELRLRQIKNFLTILLVSQGTPMLLMGDEVRRTQRGNNNAYCQDNRISWFDWRDVERHAGLLRFVRELIAFTQRCTVFREARFWQTDDGAVRSP